MRMSRKVRKQRVAELITQIRDTRIKQEAAGMKDVNADEEYIIRWRLFGPDRPSTIMGGVFISILIFLVDCFVYGEQLPPSAMLVMAAPVVIGVSIAVISGISRAVSDCVLHPDYIVVGYNDKYIRALEDDLRREQSRMQTFVANQTQQQPFKEKIQKLSGAIVDELGGSLAFEVDKDGKTRAFVELMDKREQYEMNEGDYGKLIHAIVDARETRKLIQDFEANPNMM